jgi:hypothetical protein
MIHAGTPDAQTEWDALFEGLLTGRDGIVAEMVEQAHEEPPAYGGVAFDSLVPGFGDRLRRGLGRLCSFVVRARSSQFPQEDPLSIESFAPRDLTELLTTATAS